MAAVPKTHLKLEGFKVVQEELVPAAAHPAFIPGPVLSLHDFANAERGQQGVQVLLEESANTPVLKDALAKTLNFFPWLAGRLAWKQGGHLDIDCCNKGALFGVATSSTSLEQIRAGMQPDPCTGVAAFLNNPWAARRVTGDIAPMVAQQVPLLMGTLVHLSGGGCVLGIATHHALCDFNCLQQLATHWSTNYNVALAQRQLMQEQQAAAAATADAASATAKVSGEGAAATAAAMPATAETTSQRAAAMPVVPAAAVAGRLDVEKQLVLEHHHQNGGPQSAAAAGGVAAPGEVSAAAAGSRGDPQGGSSSLPSRPLEMQQPARGARGVTLAERAAALAACPPQVDARWELRYADAGAAQRAGVQYVPQVVPLGPFVAQRRAFIRRYHLMWRGAGAQPMALHLPVERLAALKQRANQELKGATVSGRPAVEGVQWVSTNDAVCARVVQALRELPVRRGSPTTLAVVMDMRQRLTPTLPPTHLHNIVRPFLAQLPACELSLGAIAAHIRATIEHALPRFLAGLAELPALYSRHGAAEVGHAMLASLDPHTNPLAPEGAVMLNNWQVDPDAFQFGTKPALSVAPLAVPGPNYMLTLPQRNGAMAVYVGLHNATWRQLQRHSGGLRML